MKTLLILRHAKSSWHDSSLDDRERPLNARGRRDAPRMGDLLRDESLVPDLLITSDAVRAHTTALAVAEAAGYTGEIVVDPLLYHASPEDVLAVLKTVPDANARMVMIVAHNPGLEDLVEGLTGERHHLPTAALVQLALPLDVWAELDASTRATLVEIWQPKDLPSGEPPPR
ncbi:MAG TPA: histidine phosphatase family protein [Vicinamibacterales bacterium]|nr:histidine phosphatase family protein [Vicinamibacterales bacterium]